MDRALTCLILLSVPCVPGAHKLTRVFRVTVNGRQDVLTKGHKHRLMSKRALFTKLAAWQSIGMKSIKEQRLLTKVHCKHRGTQASHCELWRNNKTSEDNTLFRLFHNKMCILEHRVRLIFFSTSQTQHVHCILYRLLSSFLASRWEWASFLGSTFLTNRDLNQLSSRKPERLLWWNKTHRVDTIRLFLLHNEQRRD